MTKTQMSVGILTKISTKAIVLTLALAVTGGLAFAAISSVSTQVVCPATAKVVNGTCACSNGATNYPTCSIVPSVGNGIICPANAKIVNNQCVCINSANDYPICSTPKTCAVGTFLSNGFCVCSNGKTNPPTCTLPVAPCASVGFFSTASNSCVCSNGGKNYPTCTPPMACAAGTYLSGNACVCANGKTNPPTCTLPTTPVCGGVTILSSNNTCVCANGGTNPPTCTPPVATCPSGTIRSGSNCVCANGKTNPPTCTLSTTPVCSGKTILSSNNTCVCANGGTNPPTCTPPSVTTCPSGTKLSGTSCVCVNGMNNPSTCGASACSAPGVSGGDGKCYTKIAPNPPTNLLASVSLPVRNPTQCEKATLGITPPSYVWTCGDLYPNKTANPQIKLTFTEPIDKGSILGCTTNSTVDVCRNAKTQTTNTYVAYQSVGTYKNCPDCVANSSLVGGGSSKVGSPIIVSSKFEPGAYYTFNVSLANYNGQSTSIKSSSIQVIPPVGPATPSSVLPHAYANGYKTFANYFLATSSGVQVDILMPENKSGASPIKYTVIAEPTTPIDQSDKGRLIAISAYSPVTFPTGFLPGVAYTFTATVNNGYGTSLASAKSVAITPITTSVSSAPKSVTNIMGGAEIFIDTQGVDTGNLPITGYLVSVYRVSTSTDPKTKKTIYVHDPVYGLKDIYFSATSSEPMVIKGLIRGVRYSFSGSIVNALGVGTPKFPDQTNSGTTYTAYDKTALVEGYNAYGCKNESGYYTDYYKQGTSTVSFPTGFYGLSSIILTSNFPEDYTISFSPGGPTYDATKKGTCIDLTSFNDKSTGVTIGKSVICPKDFKNNNGICERLVTEDFIVDKEQYTQKLVVPNGSYYCSSTLDIQSFVNKTTLKIAVDFPYTRPISGLSYLVDGKELTSGDMFDPPTDLGYNIPYKRIYLKANQTLQFTYRQDGCQSYFIANLYIHISSATLELKIGDGIRTISSNKIGNEANPFDIYAFVKGDVKNGDALVAHYKCGSQEEDRTVSAQTFFVDDLPVEMNLDRPDDFGEWVDLGGKKGYQFKVITIDGVKLSDLLADNCQVSVKKVTTDGNIESETIPAPLELSHMLDVDSMTATDIGSGSYTVDFTLKRFFDKLAPYYNNKFTCYSNPTIKQDQQPFFSKNFSMPIDSNQFVFVDGSATTCNGIFQISIDDKVYTSNYYNFYVQLKPTLEARTTKLK
ncbi:MAG: hypothetical protein WCL61_01225, partial [bacterium]